ncbi:DUF2569 family protein [Cohnella silvisoli]|uniref:DUF2569 family protein n=1 Tax=Cohnella silvisoli TaxID=2873699 RepID=A0ABV1KLU8_9BACL|nr:DUF2569 family protein [Cohnella silvisoli]MCD9020585.1 DUF2569 family protein [Cohnella silvisoli]
MNETQVNNSKPKWPVSFMIISVIVFLFFPINILGYYKRQVLTFFTGGNFSMMFDVSIPWAILVLLDAIIMPVLMIVSVLCIVLLFMKHKWFPVVVKGMFIVYLSLLVLDLLANNFLSSYAIEEYKNAINSDIYRNIFRTILYCAITLPFFYYSTNIMKTYARVS